MTWAGHVAYMGDTMCVYTVLAGRPEKKRPLGRPWHERIILKWIFKN
jgi:hypothetical protein